MNHCTNWLRTYISNDIMNLIRLNWNTFLNECLHLVSNVLKLTIFYNTVYRFYIFWETSLLEFSTIWPIIVRNNRWTNCARVNIQNVKYLVPISIVDNLSHKIKSFVILIFMYLLISVWSMIIDQWSSTNRLKQILYI